MRRLAVIAGGLLVLVVTNIGIYEKEELLASGRSVFLELAPVDPRSLMQGDYMALRFRVADEAFRGIPRDRLTDGRLVLALDERHVGSFRRPDDGRPVDSREVVIRFRARNGTPKFGTNAFFFQEGHDEYYATARFGEFKVSPDGEAILTTLRGENLELLGPPK